MSEQEKTFKLIGRYTYSSKEYPSFAAFCAVIESFHGTVTAFDGREVSVQWKHAMNRNHFVDHVYGTGRIEK